ncbi:MAG: hypothetical protein AAF517_19490, partial [Planctomycetota bacterium]
VYSLGVTLFEVLTLRRPFESPTIDALYQKILKEPPPDATKLNSGISRDLKVVIETALDKDPDRRYRTAEDFAEDLRRVRRFEPILARPAGPVVRFQRWVQRNPVIATGTLVAFLLLTCGLVITLSLLSKVRDERDQKEAALGSKDRAFAELQETNETLSREKLKSEGLFLAGQGLSRVESNPTQAVLLAIEGANRHPNRLANNTIALAMPSLREVAVYGGFQRTAVDVGIRPDGKRVLARDAQGVVRVWDAETRRPVLEVEPPNVLVVNRHAVRVYRSDLMSPDGSKILSTGVAGDRVYVYDMESGHRLVSLPPHLAGLQLSSARFDPEGQRVVTAARDGSVRVWDLSDRSRPLVISHGAGVSYAEFDASGEFVLSAGEVETVSVTESSGFRVRKAQPGFVRIWKAADGAEVCAIETLGSSHATFHPQEPLVLVASRKGVSLYDVRTGEQKVEFRGNPQVEDAFFSLQGNIVVTYEGSGGLVQWNSRSGAPVTQIARGWGKLSGFEPKLSRSGEVVVAKRTANSLGLYYTGALTLGAGPYRQGDHVADLVGHSAQVTAAAFRADSERLVTGSEDGTVRTWSASASEAPWGEYPIFTGTVLNVFLSPDRRRAVISAPSTTAYYDLEEKKKLRNIGAWNPLASIVSTPGTKRGVFEFSADGKKALEIGTDTSAIRVWDLETGRSLYKGLYTRIRGGWACMSRAGDSIFFPRSKTGGAIWDLVEVSSGKTVTSLTIGADADAAFSPDGTKLVTSSNSQVALWDVSDGQQLESKSIFGGRERVLFSPDGKRILVRAHARALLWNLASPGKASTEQALEFHDGYLFGIAEFSPDGRVVACASSKNDIRLYDADSGRLLTWPLRGHKEKIVTLAFRDDGKTLASGSIDGTARVWDLETFREWVTYTHPAPVKSVEFSPEGTHLYSVSQPGRLHRWPLELTEVARGLLERKLTPDELDSFDVGTPSERLKYRRGEDAEHICRELEIALSTIERNPDARATMYRAGGILDLLLSNTQ